MLDSLPVQTKTFTKLRKQQDADETCYQLKQLCKNKWSPKHKLKGDIKKFWAVASELSVEDGLLLRGSRQVIPTSMQAEICISFIWDTVTLPNVERESTLSSLVAGNYVTITGYD